MADRLRMNTAHASRRSGAVCTRYALAFRFTDASSLDGSGAEAAAELEFGEHVGGAGGAKEFVVAADDEGVVAAIPTSLHDAAVAGQWKTHGRAPFAGSAIVEAFGDRAFSVATSTLRIADGEETVAAFVESVHVVLDDWLGIARQAQSQFNVAGAAAILGSHAHGTGLLIGHHSAIAGQADS